MSHAPQFVQLTDESTTTEIRSHINQSNKRSVLFFNTGLSDDEVFKGIVTITTQSIAPLPTSTRILFLNDTLDTVTQCQHDYAEKMILDLVNAHKNQRIAEGNFHMPLQIANLTCLQANSDGAPIDIIFKLNYLEILRLLEQAWKLQELNPDRSPLQALVFTFDHYRDNAIASLLARTQLSKRFETYVSTRLTGEKPQDKKQKNFNHILDNIEEYIAIFSTIRHSSIQFKQEDARIPLGELNQAFNSDATSTAKFDYARNAFDLGEHLQAIKISTQQITITFAVAALATVMTKLRTYGGLNIKRYEKQAKKNIKQKVKVITFKFCADNLSALPPYTPTPEADDADDAAAAAGGGGGGGGAAPAQASQVGITATGRMVRALAAAAAAVVTAQNKH